MSTIDDDTFHLTSSVGSRSRGSTRSPRSTSRSPLSSRTSRSIPKPNKKAAGCTITEPSEGSVKNMKSTPEQKQTESLEQKLKLQEAEAKRYQGYVSITAVVTFVAATFCILVFIIMTVQHFFVENLQNGLITKMGITSSLMAGFMLGMGLLLSAISLTMSFATDTIDWMKS